MQNASNLRRAAGSAPRITARQLELLRFVARAVLVGRCAPTVREIAETFGISSTNGANEHLNALERKGLLSRGDLKARSADLTDAGWAELARSSDAHDQVLAAAHARIQAVLIGFGLISGSELPVVAHRAPTSPIGGSR